MTPYAYRITPHYGREIIKPTISAVLASLKQSECPVDVALHENPVIAHYEDGTETRVDLSPYIETCEPSPEKVAEISAAVDAHIRDCEKRWAEIQRKLKPGEKYRGYSGENWIFQSDRDEQMVDPGNFAQFLEQMALPVQDYWLWDRGWNAHHFRCRNADWIEAKMLYPKHEAKFRGATPLEYVNW